MLCARGGNFVASDMLASMKPGDKAALLMVHFGTTHDDTRALTIDAINAKAAKHSLIWKCVKPLLPVSFPSS